MDKLLGTLSVYTVTLPLVTGLFFWKYQEANARIMMLLLAFASFSSIYPEYYPEYLELTYNLYTVLDVLLWSLMLYRSSRTNRVKYLVISLFLCFISFYTWYMYSHGHITKKFYSNFVCLDNVFQVMCVLLFFYEKYKTEQILNVEKDPMFWFCLAILLYAPCTYLRFALYSSNSYLNTFHSIMNILLYVMISIGLTVKINISKSIKQWIKL